MITHDRWQRIKEIFISAQDRPPAERSDYLNEVCRDDPSVREEVEALLAADADNDDFLSSPAYEFVEGMLAGEPSEFLAGQKIGRFEILCSLGAGGMGQIYLAHDESLGRKIALKLISREFATDPHRVHRFEQEARAASALNHPNVCVIHDVGRTETGRHFIAMEHIQGITLRDQLARGTFKPLEALQVTLQIGAALASAHAVGIIHRDIKPENIMLRPDGYIKVVDFGLAKLTEVLTEQRNANAQVRTDPHLLMGTVKYMSPEQLRESAIDERTDIWSLGIVLYEMLTGSTPFEARARNDSIASILAPERTELVFHDDVPTQLRKIVNKALEKDCDKRYQTVQKFTADLANLKNELEHNAEGYSAAIPPIQPSPEPFGGSRIFTRLKSQALSTADSIFNEIRTHKTATAIFAGASGVLAFLLFLPAAARVVNDFFQPPQPTPAPQVEKTVSSWDMKQLTTTGTSVSAAISPDGNLLAHAEEKNGKQQLLVTSTKTPGSYITMPAEDNVRYLGIAFSRDGQYLYFTRADNNAAGNLYRLALPGNTPVQIKSGVDSPISLSPKGDRFAFVRFTRGSEYALIVSNIDGSNEEVLATRENGDKLSVYGLAWSPDGEKVVCPESHWTPKFETSLVAFNVKDKRNEVIGGKSWFQILQVGWQEETKSFVISANENSSSPFRLWRIHMPDGVVQQITSDVADYQGVSISDGNILTVKTTLQWHLWISKPRALQQPKEITSGVGLFGLTWTRTGRIVYSSMASNSLNISRINADGSDLVQLTNNSGDNYTPAASADGRSIVFASNRNGPFNLWRMNASDGSDPVQLTFTDGNFYPSCSPDNGWVAFDNQTGSKMSAWKVPLQGGAAVKLCEGYRMPVFSPDSQLIACRYDEDSDTYDVAIFPAQGGEPLQHFKVPKQEYQSVRWFRDSRHLTFVRNDNGYSNIWSYDLDTGAETQLTHFNSDQIYAYAWSPDYTQVACQRATKSSDVTILSER
ncbi:MAG: eukaryotic-like serine/threonine-protein kinase [Acidobacteriota bacterium]|jgi:serine/threonine protein kinase